MTLKRGIYETLVTDALERLISGDNRAEVENERADDEELPGHLARHLTKAIEMALRSLPSDKRRIRQLELTNEVLKLVKENESAVNGERIVRDGELLLSVSDRAPHKVRVVRPQSPLSRSSLFTAGSAEPSLISEICHEIDSSNRIDLLVAFITWNGLRLIRDHLVNFSERGGLLRVLTTTYMQNTHCRAVELLAELPGSVVKISYDESETRHHAKAYIFHRDTGFTTAYIGSSNLSAPAVSGGLEWNVKVTEQDLPHVIEKCRAGFETRWNDLAFEKFEAGSDKSRDRLRLALTPRKSKSPFFDFEIRPYPFQEEILEELQAERELHNRTHNLVVSATGTGKTVIAAFDYRRYRAAHPRSKLLFVAHRQEILEQSRDCFRRILGDPNFGELKVGPHEPRSSDHLFISIQSYNSGSWCDLPPDFHEFVIVDEFHHAEAATYRRLLDYVCPKILLGLTATPERMDKKNVLGHFENQIAAEMRLPEALERGLLCPFHYFGVSDPVSLERVSWNSGKYDIVELQQLYDEDRSRAEIVVKSMHEYLADPLRARGLVFCVGQKHAKMMAEYLTQSGIPTDMLDAGSLDETRRTVRERLRIREINFICVVDLYNEGVDIPELDTVVFLRPTESLTVFLQQLGRGLRKWEGKDCLTVLDFIGQSRQEFRFERRYRALMRPTGRGIESEIEDGFPYLPSGSSIQLEKEATVHVLQNVRNAVIRGQRDLVARIREFYSGGLDPDLPKFCKENDIELYDIYKYSSWSRLCAAAGCRPEFDDPQQDILAKGLRRLLHLDSKSLLDRHIAFLKGLPGNLEKKTDILEESARRMLYYSLWGDAMSTYGFLTNVDPWLSLLANPVMLQEAKMLLDILADRCRVIGLHANLPYPCAMDVHCTYTRDEILAALAVHSYEKKRPMREGVLWREDLATDLFFVTLNKSDKVYSPTTMYDDYAVSERRFHWQSQSTTSAESPTGMRYQEHVKRDSKVLFFIRDRQKLPFIFAGPATYRNHSGNRPMSIEWDLEHPLPPRLWEVAGKGA